MDLLMILWHAIGSDFDSTVGSIFIKAEPVRKLQFQLSNRG